MLIFQNLLTLKINFVIQFSFWNTAEFISTLPMTNYRSSIQDDLIYNVTATSITTVNKSNNKENWRFSSPRKWEGQMTIHHEIDLARLPAPHSALPRGAQPCKFSLCNSESHLPQTYYLFVIRKIEIYIWDLW